MYNTYLNGIDFNVGIYIRLSQEDKDKKYESDSESVINQKELLRGYVKNNNFNLVKEYVDDGYSGTDFERPGFQNMLEDINNKKINCVIVKDLSRLGRDHVMTGYYIETFFPENNIRFISILESYDSFKNQASNDSSTFIIACNDYYSKQNSIKIRNVLNEKRKNGKFVGSLPCFGYMRDPLDKGHLIPNPDTASIVKKIFKWRADGIGPTEIANRLNKANVITPSGYKKTNYSSRLIDRENWNISTVKKILTNRVYTGDLVQHTQTKVNYKSKKKITLDEKLWIIVKNTHEPLVDKDTFNYVNTLRKRNTRNYEIKTNREKRLLEGKLFCKECKNRLTVLYRKKQDYWSVNCNRYSRDPVRGRCYSHFYPYNYLEEQVLEQINKNISKLIKELNIKELNDEVVKSIHKETTNIDKIVKEFQIEKEKITGRLKTLYNDKCDGVISADTYKELASEFEQKLKQINEKIEDQNVKKYKVKNKANILPDYTKKIKKLLDLNKPKKELIDTLVDKIVIDKDRNITICFKYDIVPEVNFKYENRNLARNPYGRKGKNQYSKD
ncbi:tnpX site-specific recombinase [Mycoplasma sp. CAG:877]|nr:tnpX site-specific recombinase [Mycoplasma sp. CAG:877]